MKGELRPDNTITEWATFLESGGEIAPLSILRERRAAVIPFPVDTHKHFNIFTRTSEEEGNYIERVVKFANVREMENKNPWC